jgi:hypothetical protein
VNVALRARPGTRDRHFRVRDGDRIGQSGVWVACLSVVREVPNHADKLGEAREIHERAYLT